MAKPRDKNRKPDFQPWNEEEFQADVYVRGMTHIQRWMYRTLLQASFFHGTRPYLPVQDDVLCILAGCESLEQWEANKKIVLRRFARVRVGGQQLYENKRVTADWSRLLAKREKMAEVGANGGKQKHKNKQLPNGSPALPNANHAATKEEVEVKGEKEGSEGKGLVAPSAQNPVGSTFSEKAKAYFAGMDAKTLEGIVAKAKQFTERHLVPVWQEVWGKAAQLRYPDRDKEDFEFLVNNHDTALVVDAFKLWAQEKGDGTDKWALGRFVRAAGEYMQRIEPLKNPREAAVAAQTTAQNSLLENARRSEAARATLLTPTPPPVQPTVTAADYLSEFAEETKE